MHYAHQYLRSAAAICQLYDGSMPLGAFLKDHFRQHKKFGSRDRKHIAHLCYCYYRLGHALKERSFDERAKTALFLCQPTPGIWIDLFEQDWLEHWHLELAARISFAQQRSGFLLQDVFPWLNRLSSAYKAELFALAHLVQPDLFLRVRPRHHRAVMEKLEQAAITYRLVGDNCLVLPNASKIDEVLGIDEEVVVQDLSSQHTADLLQSLAVTENLRVWDCCAASGGKSILAWDALPGIRLTASDIRDSIILNLRKRFQRAGVRAEKILVADLSAKTGLSLSPFDLVICDAPCTGSGTWSRTPEQLYHFDENRIDTYAVLQEKISRNVLPYIKTGGYLLYITCSVFARENEQVTEKLVAEGMKPIRMEWLKGYAQKADSMFAALLQKQ